MTERKAGVFKMKSMLGYVDSLTYFIYLAKQILKGFALEVGTE